MAGFQILIPRRVMVDEIITTGTGQLTGVTGWTAVGYSSRYNSWATPLPPSSSARIAVATVSSSTNTTSLAILANPDYPRAVRVAPTTSQQASGNVVVTGTNQFGTVTTDTIALGGAGSSKVDGVVAFKTITSVVLPASTSGTGTQAAVSVAIGLSNIFGLDRQVSSVAACIRGAVNGTAEVTAPIINAANETVSFTTAATSSAGSLMEVFYLPLDTTHI